MVSFFNLKAKRKRIASGGSGGKGGDIIIKASSRFNTLYRFKKKVHFKAENGKPGQPNKRNGKEGRDLSIAVPVGTLVKEADGRLIADLDREGKEAVLARGGAGGRGNASFTSQSRRFPGFAEFGEKTEERWIVLELQLLADAGLVGFPNAGKSTLISRVTAARPKIADYPFTTLVPNLGVVATPEDSFVIADIPGLIEGAHQGSGLGDRFLRHILRTSVIVFVLDAARLLQGEDMVQDYKVLQEELHLFSPKLGRKKSIIVVNKRDLLDSQEKLEEIKKALRNHTDNPILFASAATGQGLRQMLDLLEKTIKKQKAEAVNTDKKETLRVYDVHTTSAEDDKLEVWKKGDEFQVKNKQLERMVQMTDLDNEEGLQYLMHRLDKMHIAHRLKEMGVASGSTVIIDKLVFELKD